LISESRLTNTKHPVFAQDHSQILETLLTVLQEIKNKADESSFSV